jgi:hypothetical protein
MEVLLLLLKPFHTHIWDMFISLIYLTNWLYLCSTEAEGYGINIGDAPTEIK